MTARVTWLPVGHIAHGYRRVFAIFEGESLRHVVNLSPMPYEQVYGVMSLAGDAGVKDPSLWWGLSAINSLISDGTLLGPENPVSADDGFIHVRPRMPCETELLPLSTYQAILREGSWSVPNRKEDMQSGGNRRHQ